MMKRSYSILAAALLLLTSLCSTAQTQRWWGYYTDGQALSGMGTETAENYLCGVLCYTNRTLLRNGNLHGVRFYLRDKTNVSEVKVWLSTTQPATVDAANIMVVNVPQEQLADYDNDHRMVEVMLPQPYAFQSGNVYVGYSFKTGSAKTDADKQPVLTTGRGNGQAGSFWIRTSKTLQSWNNLSSRYGALAMQMLISNPSLPDQGVNVYSADRLVAVSGTQAQANAYILSDGLGEVSSIDYVISIDGQQQQAQHYTLPQPISTPENNLNVLPVAVNMPTASGSYKFSVQVTQVNGQPNGSSHSLSEQQQLIAADRLGHHRPVVEEYTGTWCVNCPRGIVGMQLLSEQFADDFIGIAIHVNNGSVKDPMTLAAYSPLEPDAVPSCFIDRQLKCDPYLGTSADPHFHANEAFATMLSQNVEADVQLTASWADESQTQLQLHAATTFYLNSQQADYALAFVVTADGLRGDGKEWWQVNGESGSTLLPDADMDWFRNAPNPVTDIAYNHVAIAATDIVKGIDGSIASPLLSGQAQTYTATIDLSQNTLIQDKGRLHGIVLLIDKATNRIVNAAKSTIGTSSAVLSVAADSQQKALWYTLDGRSLTQAPTQKGLYIKNGKKTIVK